MICAEEGSELDDVANKVFAAHVLTQEEVEEEAVLWANLKRNLANKALVCLHKLSIDVTDICCNGIVRR